MRVLVIASNMGNVCRNSIVKQNNHDVDFICLDDNTFSNRDKSMQPRLVGKIPKMLAWKLYPGYDRYMWIDQMFSLRNPDAVDWFIKELGDDNDVLFFPHSARTSIKSEFEFVDSLMKVDNQYLISRYENERMKEQIDDYLNDDAFNDNFLIEAGAFMYNPRIVENKEHNVLKEWFYQNCLYSVQDQLSLPYVLQKFNIQIKFADTSIYDCKYLK